MELGEEIEHFFEIMKKQTGFDLGMLIQKKYLDENEWNSVRSSGGLRNNWGDQTDVVVVGQTVGDESLIRFEGNVETVPDGGKVAVGKMFPVVTGW